MPQTLTRQEVEIVGRFVADALARGENHFVAYHDAAVFITEHMGSERTARGIKRCWDVLAVGTEGIRVADKPRAASHMPPHQYTPQEDDLISLAIAKAILQDHLSAKAGIRRAVVSLKERLGVSCTVGAIENRWCKTLYPALPPDIRQQIKDMRDRRLCEKLTVASIVGTGSIQTMERGIDVLQHTAAEQEASLQLLSKRLDSQA